MKKKSKFHDIHPHATEIILESISEGVFTVDHNWKITSFNKAATEITGISRDEAVGKHCWEVFRSNMCESGCFLRQTMKQKKSFVGKSVYIVNSRMQKIPISLSTALLKDEKGRVIGGVETFRDMTLVEELRKELDGRLQIGDMTSKSASMHRIFDILPRVAESDSTVMIQGETGTGKELLARAIHELSSRRKKPFTAINCGALPDNLLESELFGYKAGAFTGAVKDKPGHFAAAKGGTILLDEIGDISPAFQVRLLRVLQEMTFTPLGSTTPVKADVRVITASNKNIEHMLENEEFRQDLFYRINVVRLELPPLRDRKEDIPLLVEKMIERLNRLKARNVAGIAPEALRLLMAYDYPGNIRELENIIEYAFVLCNEAMIGLGHMPKHLIPESDFASQDTGRDTLKTAEARAIKDALKRNNYNRLATASELGVHKSTLFRKIKSLKISLPEKDGRSGPRKS
ncbi:Transcriptional regulator, sigma54-dependent [Desulfonema limicola]|uniref:Transcriptional regulator, sigma54-dependent n=1 Tax=Desulfonema limicola TaxID=45656 RepID=A0A975B706_9BACT|nr:sigma 54-interacting transcriptional regulator [Desulfonema limicola]QTA79986.1 Transcriptional regulator, sigma54-dependent [Desulfonema limicola]